MESLEAATVLRMTRSAITFFWTLGPLTDNQGIYQVYLIEATRLYNPISTGK